MRIPPEVLDRIANSLLEPIPLYADEAKQRIKEQHSLYEACLVSRQFNSVFSRQLYRDPLLKNTLVSIFKFTFTRFQTPSTGRLRLFSFVKRLDLRSIDISGPIYRHLIKLLQYCPNIQVLGIESSSFNEEMIEHLLQLARVKRLGLRGKVSCSLSQKISPFDPMSIFSELSLQGLDFSQLSFDENQMFFTKLCVFRPHSVEYLNLGKTWIENSVLGGLVTANLSSLWLDECTRVTDDAIAAVATQCPLLDTVKLRNCVLVGDSGVCALAQKCRNLRRLGISYTKCADASIKALQKYSKKLDTLFINDLMFESEECLVDLLVARGDTMVTLGACGAEKLSFKTISTLAGRCLNIREIDVGQCMTSDPVQSVDEAFKELVFNCQKLTTVVCWEVNMSINMRKMIESKYSTIQFWLEHPRL